MTENQNHPGERIAKVIARAGLCSRRDAEVWVADGRVAVNGKKLDSPAFNVQPDDKITVDGAPLAQRERTRLFFFHKPRGTVTTAHDPEGRMTVFDALPKDLPRVVTVGRLDINTEGLLLLTNDGGLARALELPSTGWLRRYRVRAHGRTDQARLDELSKGLTIEGINYRGIEARLDREQGSNVWLTIGLREGKNREVRKVMEHIGLEVNRLIRVSFGPFQLGELAESAVEEVKTRILKDQLGDKIAGLANADFDAPLYGESEDNDRAPKGRGPNDRDERSDAFVRSREPRGYAQERPADPDAPRESPKPGKRRHISTLREDAKARSGKDSDRKRIERGQTADRSGRPVAVERVVAPTRKSRFDDESPKPARRSSRNARNFAALANPEAASRSTGDRPRQRNAGASRNDQDGDRARPARREDSRGRPDRSFGERTNAGSDRGRGDSKFKRPERDFGPPRNRRAEFNDPVVPDRIPWGAPQADDGDSGHRNNRPERSGRENDRNDRPAGGRFARSPSRPEGGSGKFRSDRKPGSSSGGRSDRPDFRQKRDDGEGRSRSRDTDRSGGFAARVDPPYRDFGKSGGGSRDGGFGKPGGRSGGRPASRSGDSGGRSSERPRGETSGRSFDKPFGRPGGKPDGKSFGKPGGRPGGRPDSKPGGGYGGGPGGSRSGGRPGGGSGGRPPGGSGPRPGGARPGGARPGGPRTGGPRPGGNKPGGNRGQR